MRMNNITFVSKHVNCQQQLTYLHSRSRCSCATASAVAVDVVCIYTTCSKVQHHWQVIGGYNAFIIMK